MTEKQGLVSELQNTFKLHTMSVCLFVGEGNQCGKPDTQVSEMTELRLAG